MKYQLYLSVLCFSCLISSCSTPDVKFSTDFDKGSLGEMVKVSENYYRGSTQHWLKRDGIGDQYYWFDFKADHVKDREITFELTDLQGVYRGNPHVVFTDYTQPVYSYDQENWSRIENVKYDSAAQSFQFTHRFTQEPVWIAYAHPYPVTRYLSLIERMRDYDFVDIETLAKTQEDREVYGLTITDKQVPVQDKKSVLIMALQHAGEDAGGFMVEGLVNFLISDAPEARHARSKFIYKIIPMMNPDGIYHGTSRYNMQMEDLNNIWLDDENAQPEVTGVKRWVNDWYGDGNQIDLFMDVHNHTQFHTYNVIIFQDHSLDTMQMEMNKYWPIRVWHSGFKGSSCAYFFNKGIPSGTIELSQGHLDDGKYLRIDDFHAFGRGTVLALNDYF